MTDRPDPPETSKGSDAGAVPRVDGVTADWSTVVHHLGELSDVRHSIAAALAGSGWAAARVDDLLLAVTELVVNALTHGQAQAVDVSVDVTREPRQVSVVIRHVDRWPSQLSERPTMAAPNELRGRGRAVVAAVADGFDTRRQEGNEVLQIVRFHP
jgi:anti-sigma regulatory factor (Ser/Thr protein kinase)